MLENSWKMTGAILVCLLATRALAQKPELVVQAGHTTSINTVVLSPDGKLLASGSSDASVKLWEVSTGRELRTLLGHEPKITALIFTPDSKTLASASYDKTIRLWDVATGRARHTLSGHSKWIVSLAISNDGRVLASGGNDSTIKLWNMATGQEIRTLRPRSRYISLLMFNTGGVGGGGLTSVGSDGQITLWDVATGGELRTLSVPLSGATPIAISADGKMLASRNPDRKAITLWDTTSGKKLRVFSGHSDNVASAVFHSQMLISGGWDETIRFWNTAMGGELKKFPGLDDSINDLAISGDGKILAGVMSRGEIRLWETAMGSTLRTLTGYPTRIWQVDLHPNGRAIFSSDSNGNAKLWNVATGGVRRLSLGYKLRFSDALITPEGTIQVIEPYDRGLRLWDLATSREIYAINVNWGATRPVLSSPDGKLLAIGADREIKLLDATTGRILQIFSNPTGPIAYPLAITQDGKILASRSGEQTIKLWDTSTGLEVRAFSQSLTGAVKAIFSPDGRVLAVSGLSQTLSLWEISTGRELFRLPQSHISPSVLAFSPNSKLIATSNGDYDGVVQLWDVETGRELRVFNKHVGDVNSLAFTSDGKMLVTGGDDGTIRLWEVADGNLIATLSSLGADDWAVVDYAGRFDASQGGMKSMHYAVGVTTIALEQLKERYYDPGLLPKLLGHSRQRLRNVSAFNEVRLFPEAELSIAPNSSQLNIRLTNRGGGIGRVQVFVNNSLLAEDARAGRRVNTKATRVSLTVDLSKAANHNPGAQNRVRVVTWNDENFISSPAIETEWLASGAIESGDPVLYAIVGGISTYGDARMNLQYSAADARQIAEALKLAAARLFGGDMVKISLLAKNSSPPAAGISEMEPTKPNFLRALDAVSKQARPKDIFVIFLAGHGVSLGANNSEYAYLTTEARSLDKSVLADPEVLRQSAITSSELSDWMTTRIAANKRVLILDTCEAGAVSTDLALARTLPGDQLRALDRLKDRTGFYVMMGAAASKASYETTSYGQGLLTYSLLKGIKGAALREEKFVDVIRLFSYAEDEVPRLAESSGSAQQPHFMAKEGASFDIGMLERTDRELIKLAQTKPFLLPPLLTNPATSYDDLELVRALREALREACLKNEINAVFVSAEDLPGAIRPSGTYQVIGNMAKVKMVLIKDGRPAGEVFVEGLKSDLAELVKKLIEALGPQIDKLLPQ